MTYNSNSYKLKKLMQTVLASVSTTKFGIYPNADLTDQKQDWHISSNNDDEEL